MTAYTNHELERAKDCLRRLRNGFPDGNIWKVYHDKMLNKITIMRDLFGKAHETMDLVYIDIKTSIEVVNRFEDITNDVENYAPDEQ